MRLQILLVDDDPEDLELLEEALLETQPGSDIQKAVGGEAAIKCLNACPDAHLPHLIVLDYNMSDISGLEVLTYIKDRKRYDKIPRIMFSTSDAERYILESLKHGATKYLVKPKSKRELDELALQMLSLAYPR